MKLDDISIELIYDLSKEVLKGKQIDLGDFSIDENAYLNFAALNVIEYYKTLPDEQQLITALSNITVLMLENFLLEVKILKMLENKKIAIVADWIKDWGGAEMVLSHMIELFPEADIFTSVFYQEKNPIFK